MRSLLLQQARVWCVLDMRSGGIVEEKGRDEAQSRVETRRKSRGGRAVKGRREARSDR